MSQMVQNGMNVARINFSHATEEEKLGENILTAEEYTQIMGEGYLRNDFDFFCYNKKLIEKLHLEIFYNDIYSWHSENTRQKRLI